MDQRARGLHKLPNAHRAMTTPLAVLDLSGQPGADVHGVVDIAGTESLEVGFPVAPYAPRRSANIS